MVAPSYKSLIDALLLINGRAYTSRQSIESYVRENRPEPKVNTTLLSPKQNGEIKGLVDRHRQFIREALTKGVANKHYSQRKQSFRLSIGLPKKKLTKSNVGFKKKKNALTITPKKQKLELTKLEKINVQTKKASSVEGNVLKIKAKASKTIKSSKQRVLNPKKQIKTVKKISSKAKKISSKAKKISSKAKKISSKALERPRAIKSIGKKGAIVNKKK